ncbi:MAG: phage tail tube protein, partial [Myxococcota bacterium]
GGLRARSFDLSQDLVDVTHGESSGRWRELLGGAGVRRGRIEGAGIFRDEASDERVRALTVRMLRKHGYTTIEAATTREGRDVFDIEGGKIDLVVSDIVMPDGRGPELAARLCAREPNVRVLLMTGYDDDSLDQKILQKIPHYELLRKPFVEGALMRAVRDLLARPEVNPEVKRADPTGRPRVLLVDDDAGTRRTYQRLLGEDFDLQVLDDSLEDVLDTLRREDFDIIFFDVMMPRVSGFDLAERAAAVSPENAKRIVHLTGMQDDTLVTAYAEQMNQHIVSKPLTIDKLNSLLAAETLAASALAPASRVAQH